MPCPTGSLGPGQERKQLSLRKDEKAEGRGEKSPAGAGLVVHGPGSRLLDGDADVIALVRGDFQQHIARLRVGE